MKQLASQQLYAYWNRLRGARAAPERSDIDPGAIRAILADTFLADVVGDRSMREREFIIRLAGSRLNGLWGQDLVGVPLVSLWRPDDRLALNEILDLVLDDQVPVVAGARRQDDAATPCDLEALFLPLRHRGKTHARLLGSIVANAETRFTGREPLRTVSLTSFRSVSMQAPASVGIALPARQHGRFMVYEGGR